MQPIKLEIEGKYWDSQIYSGILYLFTLDGEIISIDWEKLINRLNIEENLKLALLCAFSRSDYLYSREFDLLFGDREIKHVITNKFLNLSNYDLIITKNKIEEYTLTKQDSPFPFPHSDSTIYLNNIYTSSKDGIHRATCNRRRSKYVVSTRREKKWDAPSLSVTGSYGSLAVAAGDEGLFEIGLKSDFYDDKINFKAPRLLSSSHCSDCGWTFYSIFASSHVADGYHATFKKEKIDDRVYKREFNEIKFSRNIFNNSGYSWGTQDKIYKVSGNIISIVKYSPWQRDNNEEYHKLGEIHLENWKGNVVSGKNALFGIVIECENAIVVKLSNDDFHNIPGEPVNWRIFPRSKYYENQLHIIYDDRLSIYSFNQDYFVDQRLKKIGSEHLFFKGR